MTNPARLDLDEVTRVFDSGGSPLRVLDRITLRIEPGEMVAILGPSGSGKSTLLALMAGLDRPSQGSILLDGVNLSDLDEDELARLRRHRVGFVFQSFQLLGHLTARENVELPSELLGRADARARADELLARVGLADRSHHYPVQLSGGEQQRVALARAFAGEPALLLADEPTGNLDRGTGATILEILGELHREGSTTGVVVTHDPDTAAIADRRIYLRDGRIEHIEA